jgi:ankyrin repeat protein
MSSAKQNKAKFHSALLRNNLEEVQALLPLVKINTKFPEAGYSPTPLIIACENGFLDLARLLLRAPGCKVGFGLAQ